MNNGIFQRHNIDVSVLHRFLIDSKCYLLTDENNTIVSSEDHQTKAAVARWNYIFIQCDNLLKPDISLVLCDRSCYNLKKSTKFKRPKKLSGYQSVHVTREREYELRDGKGFVRLSLPVSCNCVLRKSLSKKASNRRKTNRTSWTMWIQRCVWLCQTSTCTTCCIGS